MLERDNRGLGVEVPEPLPLSIQPAAPEVEASPTLSLTARPGDGSIAGRKVAILVAAGVDARGVREGLLATRRGRTGQSERTSAGRPSAAR